MPKTTDIKELNLALKKTAMKKEHLEAAEETIPDFYRIYKHDEADTDPNKEATEAS